MSKRANSIKDLQAISFFIMPFAITMMVIMAHFTVRYSSPKKKYVFHRGS